MRQPKRRVERYQRRYYSPRQAFGGANYLASVTGGGLATSPGTKTGLELNAPVTSRKWRPSPKPASDAPVSVIDCIYRFDGEGEFTGTGGTWGDARYIELYMLADDDEYLKAKTGICFVNLVEYDFVVTTRAADTTPDAFAFTDATGVNLSTVTESNAITVAGIEAAASFTVTGGTAEKNASGTWAASGTVENGDTIKVRGTSSASYETAVNVVLTIGGVSDTFTITTKAEPVGGGSEYDLTIDDEALTIDLETLTINAA